MRNRNNPLIDWLLLMALVVMFGSAFMLTKIAVEYVSPQLVVAGRLTIGAVVLLILVVANRQSLSDLWRLGWFVPVLAVMGNCAPFFLISWGQQGIDSGLAGILMAVMPLVTVVLIQCFVAEDRLSGMGIAGFVLGFLGIVVLMGADSLTEFGVSGENLMSELAVLAGAVCYSINSVIARRLPPHDFLMLSAAVILTGSLIMLPPALLTESTWAFQPSFGVIVSLILLGVFPTGLATIVYFKLIASAGPAFMSQINYLLPVWAVLMGVLFLDEALHWNTLIALLLILAGIALTQISGRTPVDPPIVKG